MSAVCTFDGLAKSFGPNRVLRGVSFAIEAGSVHALLGQNGAGKSTLMRILVGAETADGGTIRIGGDVYRPRGTAEARRRGVVLVPQERTLCPDLTVVENVVLGLEPARGGFLRRVEARAIAERALALVAGDGARTAPIASDARVGSLGVAEQQLVEIARALTQAGASGEGSLAGRILVLDEPTSSLGHDDAARLFARVHTLRERGLTVVLVTHFLADVRAHADRYTVLRDGTVQGEGDAKTTDAKVLVREMLGRELVETRREVTDDARRGEPASDEAANDVGSASAEHASNDDVLLEVRGLAADVRFTLRRGEVLGIAGLVGSGRTEILRAIAGLDPSPRGTIVSRAPRGIGLLSEDRGGEGLMLARSIADNVTLSARGPRFAWPKAILAEGARWIDRLAIRAAGPAQTTAELSGGNQQKVQIARLLREDYDVLLFDEPTRGIDVASKAQVLALVRELASAGKGIILVSSQLDELVAACDRIAVLRRGVLAAPSPAAGWDEGRLLLEASA